MAERFLQEIGSERLTIEKSVDNELAVPFHQVVDVTKDATIRHEQPLLVLEGSCFHLPHSERVKQLDGEGGRW